VILILGVDVSIETHIKSDKLTINFEKEKKWQIDLFKICAKLKDHILEIKNSKTKFKLDKYLKTKYDFSHIY
jgi:hypothetical protein